MQNERTFNTVDDVPITIVESNEGYEPPTDTTKIEPTMALDGWYIAEPLTFPKKQKVIVRRKDHLYFAEFQHHKDGKVYVSVDGGTNSIPRVVDLWRPVPEDWGDVSSPAQIPTTFQWRMSPKVILDGDRYKRVYEYITVQVLDANSKSQNVKDIKKYVRVHDQAPMCNLHITDEQVISEVPLDHECLIVAPRSGLTRRQFNLVVSLFGRPINSF